MNNPVYLKVIPNHYKFRILEIGVEINGVTRRHVFDPHDDENAILWVGVNELLQAEGGPQEVAGKNDDSTSRVFDGFNDVLRNQLNQTDFAVTQLPLNYG